MTRRRRSTAQDAGELEVSVVGGASYRFTDPAEAGRTYKRLRREGLPVQLCWRTRRPASDRQTDTRPAAA